MNIWIQDFSCYGLEGAASGAVHPIEISSHPRFNSVDQSLAEPLVLFNVRSDCFVQRKHMVRLRSAGGTSLEELDTKL